MKKIPSLLFFCFITVFCYSQTEKLNQFDAKGKKDGKWIVWLDKYWDKVKDSTKAVYFRYNYFDHGASLYPMGPCGKKGYTLDVKSTSTVKKGNAMLLDGEYTWKDAKGNLSSVHILKNGEYFSCKEYYPTGELNQHFDYTKKCPGHVHGWGAYIYDKTGKLILTSWMCKDRDGEWPATKG